MSDRRRPDARHERTRAAPAVDRGRSTAADHLHQRARRPGGATTSHWRRSPRLSGKAVRGKPPGGCGSRGPRHRSTWKERIMNKGFVAPASRAAHAAPRLCDAFDSLVGRSTSMLDALQKARLLTKVDVPVLLQGETGVGKEVFARAIHDGGRNRHG